MDGSLEAAAAFAAASTTPDGAGLAKYVKLRATLPDETSTRSLLAQVPKGRDRESARALAQEIAAVGSIGDPLLAVRLAEAHAKLLAALGRSAAAAAAFARGAAAAEGIGWLQQAGTCFRLAGLQHHRLLDFAGMERVWTRWLAVEVRRENTAGIARAQSFLGNVYAELGEYARSIDTYGEARATYERLGLQSKVGFVLQNEGLVHERRGSLRTARALYARSFTLLPEAQAYQRARTLMLLAGVDVLLGAPEDALRQYAQAQTLLAGMTEKEAVAAAVRCQGGKGHALRVLARYEEAEEAARLSLEGFRRVGDKQGEVAALMGLGRVHMAQGEPAHALGPLREALSTSIALKDPWLELGVRQALAELQLDAGRAAEARKENEAALALAQRLGAVTTISEAYMDRAAVQLAERKFDDAWRDAQRGIELLLPSLAGFADEQGARARAHRERSFHILLDAAIGTGRPEVVYLALETGRAGALLETLSGRDAIRRASLPEALLEKEEAARRTEVIAAARHRRALRGRPLSEIRAQRAALDKARRDVQAIVETIQREAKSASELLYPKPAPLADVRASLAVGEVLVLYGATKTQAVALVVDAKRARLVQLGAALALDEACATLHEVLSDSEADPDAALAALSARTVKPLGLTKAVRRVLVSPAAGLFEIPMGSLFEGRTVSFIPSATTYEFLHAQPALRGADGLVLGNPDYAGARGLPRLQGSLQEANAIARLVGGTRMVGKQASETRLREVVAREKPWRVVHLACHGLIDRDRPMLSSLALTQGLETDDGYLTALEVFRMRVPAELVVLSACETGAGRVFQGEGLVGLTRAFMFAGSPRVIVSLWRVDDEATRDLMVKFYELWLGTGGKPALGAAEALRQAQDSIRAQERWAHPYYWAAWVLWGLPD